METTGDLPKNGYLISTDPARLEIPTIHQCLTGESYWAINIPVEVVQKSIANSFCFKRIKGFQCSKYI